MERRNSPARRGATVGAAAAASTPTTAATSNHIRSNTPVTTPNTTNGEDDRWILERLWGRRRQSQQNPPTPQSQPPPAAANSTSASVARPEPPGRASWELSVGSGPSTRVDDDDRKLPANTRSAPAVDFLSRNNSSVDLTSSMASPMDVDVINLLDDGDDDVSMEVVEETARPVVASARPQPDANQWACARCTLFNSNWQSQCSACHYSGRPIATTAHSSTQDGVRTPDLVCHERLIGSSSFADPWMSDAANISSPRMSQAAASPPLGLLSRGALLGGVLGATGAYLRGQPLAVSAVEGAVTGAVSGAVLHEVLAHQQQSRNQQQQYQEAVAVAEEPTVHRIQNPYRTALTFRRIPRNTSPVNARPRRPRRASSFTGSVRRRGSNDTSFDDVVLQYMMELETALIGLRSGVVAHPNIDGMSYDQLLQAFGDGSDNLGGCESDIQQLPVVTLQDPARELPEDSRRCHICLEDFGPGDQRKALPCWHGFHQACADKWLRTNGSCPVCKYKIGNKH